VRGANARGVPLAGSSFLAKEAITIPTPRHRKYLVPSGDVERRVAALQSAMQSNGIGVAWIEHLADRLYFSGSPQDGVLLMPSEGAPVFLVRKSLKRAEQEGSVAVEPYPGGGAVVERARILAGTAGTVGLGLDVSPAATYARLLGPGGVERIVDLSATVRAIRSVKSPWEIEQIRRAADQVTTLYAGIVEHLRPGITELELTGRVEGRRLRDKRALPDQLQRAGRRRGTVPPDRIGCRMEDARSR
jgi:Xaa-Pro aminopeptidase